jgi:hypothetical protein
VHEVGRQRGDRRLCTRTCRSEQTRAGRSAHRRMGAVELEDGSRAGDGACAVLDATRSAPGRHEALGVTLLYPCVRAELARGAAQVYLKARSASLATRETAGYVVLKKHSSAQVYTSVWPSCQNATSFGNSTQIVAGRRGRLAKRALAYENARNACSHTPVPTSQLFHGRVKR